MRQSWFAEDLLFLSVRVGIPEYAGTVVHALTLNEDLVVESGHSLSSLRKSPRSGAKDSFGVLPNRQTNESCFFSSGTCIKS
jgi:hypothetical protein